MSKGNTFENDMLKLIFNATTIANLAVNAASSPLTVFYLSLHTADPGEAGDQTTNEISYTGYARVAVNRATGAGGFTVTTANVKCTDSMTFAEMTGGTGGTLTHIAVGTASSGAGKILYSGATSKNPIVIKGVKVQLRNIAFTNED